MSQPPVPIEVLQDAVRAFGQTGNKTAAAKLLGLPRNTFATRLAIAQRDGITAESTLDQIDEHAVLRDKIRTLESQVSSFHRETLDERYVREKILKLREGYDTIKPPEWLLAERKGKGKSYSTPNLLLSDLHWAENVDLRQMSGVNEYNIAIANKRLKTVIHKPIELLRNHITNINYPGFILALGGDMLAGDIHEELTGTNEVPVFPALLNLMEALIAAIKLLAKEFGFVYVPCVAGNHGRTTRKPRAKQRNETNLDWLLYQFLALQFQDDPRVTIDSPTSPELTYKVFNHTYHLCHGDQLGKGGDGIIGSFGPIIRGDHKRRSLQSQLNNPYNTLLHGHYHTYAATQRFISNGSLVGYDEYALANGLGYEVPQQAFWLTHAEYGITFSMPIHAEAPKKLGPAPWVSFEKR